MSSGLVTRLRHLVGSSESTPDAHEGAGIRLVVGLGNPGKEYAGTRRNIGFWTMNRLARRHGMDFSSAGKASLAEGTINAKRVALAKPRVFVNESGPVVWNLIKRLELDDASELLVVRDDIDLPQGKLRLRPSGGSGGHKGVKSIIDAVGSDQFPRLRIGIGRPVVQGKPSWEPEHVADYVLSDPSSHERDILDKGVDRAIDAIEMAIAEGLEAAMQRYN
jgi:PTH1 family peptidyl-tRNA hydrolase